MCDLVFARVTVAAEGVAPVMFDDEFFERAFRWERERGGDARGDAILVRGAFAKPQPWAGRLPRVGERIAWGEFGAGDLDFTVHGAGDVVFVVEAVGDDRDGAARNDLAGEDDTSADFSADRAADIVAKVNLREARVTGEANAEKADVFEAEADNADVGLAVVDVGLGAGWREVLDYFRGDGEVEKNEVAPFGG